MEKRIEDQNEQITKTVIPETEHPGKKTDNKPDNKIRREVGVDEEDIEDEVENREGMEELPDINKKPLPDTKVTSDSRDKTREEVRDKTERTK